MKDKPVNVGIPYNNEQERKWAIAQAERYGYNEFEDNYIDKKDNCIWLDINGIWFDYELDEDAKTIPLERPEPKVDYTHFQNGFDNIEVKSVLSFSQDDLTTSEVPVLTFQKGDLLGNQLTVFSLDPEKYERTDKEDGTIILKPKKKKVKIWIEVYEEDGLVKTLIHNTRDNLDTSVAELEDERAVLLEVIEREYEI